MPLVTTPGRPKRGEALRVNVSSRPCRLLPFACLVPYCVLPFLFVSHLAVTPEHTQFGSMLTLDIHRTATRSTTIILLDGSGSRLVLKTSCQTRPSNISGWLALSFHALAPFSSATGASHTGEGGDTSAAAARFETAILLSVRAP